MKIDGKYLTERTKTTAIIGVAVAAFVALTIAPVAGIVLLLPTGIISGLVHHDEI